MVQLAEAYFNGKNVKPIWSDGKFSTKDKNTKFEYSESVNYSIYSINISEI